MSSIHEYACDILSPYSNSLWEKKHDYFSNPQHSRAWFIQILWGYKNIKNGITMNLVQPGCASAKWFCTFLTLLPSPLSCWQLSQYEKACSGSHKEVTFYIRLVSIKLWRTNWNRSLICFTIFSLPLPSFVPTVWSVCHTFSLHCLLWYYLLVWLCWVEVLCYIQGFMVDSNI